MVRAWTWILVLGWLGVAGVARADSEEVTLHVEAGPAMVRGEAPVFSSDVTTRPGGAGSVRLTYGLTDLFAAEVSLGGAAAEALEYSMQDGGDLGVGTSHFDLRALRVTAGMTARFGARWIPTATVAAGYQHRLLTGGMLIDDERVLVDYLPTESSSDLLVMAGVGLEYRIDRHFIVGLSAQLVHAFALGGKAFDGVEIPMRVSYSWYPGWFKKQTRERLDD